MPAPAAQPALPKEALDAAVRRALEEDVGSGDLTTSAVIPEGLRARAKIVAREACVVAGLRCARRVFEMLDAGATFPSARADGDSVGAGETVLVVEARARAILSGERSALNFVQRLSGVATATRRHVEKAASGGAAPAVLDTRKTTPGLRALERAAVAAGGGRNHRFGLFDQVLLKENHFALSGLPVAETVRRAREKVGPSVVIGAEARNHEEALAVVDAGADYVLLDNFAPDALAAETALLRKRIAQLGKRTEIEASGGIDEERIAAFARSGVDRLSCGSLTHSARAIDFALDTEPLR